MMFLRSNHIKEVQLQLRDACKMAWHAQTLQEASVMALLCVLTLHPAAGSSQLAQCYVKQPGWRATENILQRASVSRFPSCCRLFFFFFF